MPIAFIFPRGSTNIEIEGIVRRNLGTDVNEDFAYDADFMREGLTPEEQQEYRDMQRLFEFKEGGDGSTASKDSFSDDAVRMAIEPDDVVAPLFGYVGAGARLTLHIKHHVECLPTPNSKNTVKVRMGDPLVSALDCSAAAASFLGSFVPGLDCAKLAFSLTTKAIKSRATKKPFVSGPAFWFDLGRSMASCAVSLCTACVTIKKAVELTQTLSRITKGEGAFAACSTFGSVALFGNERQVSTSCVAAVDPNDKFGSDGVGEKRFINGTEPLKYLITFENKPDATAPAQEVVITDQLDAATLDLSTFHLGPFSFGDRTIDAPPAASTFITDVDLRPAKNLILRVNAALDKATGVVTWRFTSLDPATAELPMNPLVGFLPPNQNSPEGEGSVFFTVMPKADLPSGTEIRNRATIVFDSNAPIDTGEWLNTIDNAKPSSQVISLPAQSPPSFELRWAGSDAQSGIQNYTVFVSEAGGPFAEWLTNTTATSAVYQGQADKTYSFYTVARDGTGLRESPPASPDATTTTSLTGASVVQFAAPSFATAEACAAVPVTVTRTGDTSQAAAVNYASADGSATERRDYSAIVGTLRFAPGETQQSIVVLVNEDSIAEGDEVLTLTLSNPSGATLGAQSTATFTITDDAVEPAGNAIDETRNYVCQQYHDFLNRQADQTGEEFWTNNIEQCGANAGCRQVFRVETSAAFFLSIEFRETGYVVIRANKAAFGAAKNVPRYRDFIRDQRVINDGVVVGAPGWEARLASNKQAYLASLVTRSDFIAQFPEGMAAGGYVDKLFANAGVTPTTAERSAAVAAYGAGDLVGRAAALLSVIESGSIFNAHYNPAFVLMQYFGYLRRDPNSAPDTDFTGYDFWLGKMDSFSLPGEDMRDDAQAMRRAQRAEMVRAFLESIEYRQRFGQ